MNDPAREYLVSHKHRLIVCTIPKCGSSTLTHWFFRLNGLEPGANTSRGHAVKRFGMYRVPAKIRPGLMRDYRTVAIIRNPCRRLSSAYVNKFVNSCAYKPARKIIREMQRRAGASFSAQRGITFREFIAWLSDHDPLEFDLHWRPQSWFLHNWTWTDIWPVAGLDARLRSLNRDLGVDIPISRVHPTGAPLCYDGGRVLAADMLPMDLRARSAYPAHDSFYDTQTIKAVREIYARDIALGPWAVEGNMSHDHL